MKPLNFGSQLALAVNNPQIKEFAKTHAGGLLKLRPAFQRNLVWNSHQRSYLVDSILRNLPVPEIYVQQVERASDGETETVVVDGQQRLSTCIQFLSNNLRLEGDELDPQWKGRTYSELGPDLQKRFREYRFVVRNLPELLDSETREIFRRLNRVVEPLVPQELRHAAFCGPYIKCIELVAAHPALQEFRVFTSRDYQRRSSDELVAEVALAVTNGAFPNKKEGLDESFRMHELNAPPIEMLSNLRRRFGRVFAQLEMVSAAVKRTRFRKKSDFYSLVVHLMGRAESLPLSGEWSKALGVAMEALSDKIAQLRKRVQAKEPLDSISAEEASALKYMRAVERAASDRLNRVKRDEVLLDWLGPILAHGQVTTLSESDEAWVQDVAESDDASDGDADGEREHLQVVLDREEPPA